MRKALSSGGLSIAEMADYLEVSRQSVGAWVNDRTPASKQTMRLWSMRCGVPLEWLETGQAPTSPSGPADLVHHLGLEPRTHWLGVSNVRELRPVAA